MKMRYIYPSDNEPRQPHMLQRAQKSRLCSARPWQKAQLRRQRCQNTIFINTGDLATVPPIHHRCTGTMPFGSSRPVGYAALHGQEAENGQAGFSLDRGGETEDASEINSNPHCLVRAAYVLRELGSIHNTLDRSNDHVSLGAGQYAPLPRFIRRND
jgi:hypothetical protein